MFRTLLYLLAAGAGGCLFAWLQVPAGFLIGSLLVGVFYRLRIGELSLPPYVFPFALALIGANIGLTMKLSMFAEVASYFIPLIISLVAILLGSWLLSRLLARFSTLDPKTALFCCVPGGASVMLALSEEYGADQRIVAAFQSARVLVVVLAIPLLAGLMAGLTGAGGGTHAAASASDTSTGVVSFFPGFRFLCVLAIMALGLGLAKVVKIPAAQFLYAMLIAFLVNQFVVPLGSLPTGVVGFGQILLGANIGLRFDRTALLQLKKIGWLSTGILMMFLVLTFAISLIFYFLTPLDYVTSMLSMSPGGAPQMSSTAAVLNLDASIVASVQLVRLLIIFLLLPVVIPYLVKKRYGAGES
ncbi:MAG TPA: AbrB family transcriptional regulator [Bacillales bacterium]|nr:AbrB family transcriptional regulator [Bacillales bacterium]